MPIDLKQQRVFSQLRSLGHSNFVLVSDFDIRISDLQVRALLLDSIGLREDVTELTNKRTQSGGKFPEFAFAL